MIPSAAWRPGQKLNAAMLPVSRDCAILGGARSLHLDRRIVENHRYINFTATMVSMVCSTL